MPPSLNYPVTKTSSKALKKLVDDLDQRRQRCEAQGREFVIKRIQVVGDQDNPEIQVEVACRRSS